MNFFEKLFEKILELEKFAITLHSQTGDKTLSKAAGVRLKTLVR